MATRDTIHQAYVDALAGDPVSAFGGILISNVEIDKPPLKRSITLFCEVVIAPVIPRKPSNSKRKEESILLIKRNGSSGYHCQDLFKWGFGTRKGS